MTLYLAAIALAVTAAISGTGAMKLTSMHYEHVIDVAAREAAANVQAADQRAANAATDYEVWASSQRPKTVTVTREIEREVKADVDCSVRPLPAGLRDALTKAGAGPDQPVADGAMPAAPAAGLGDLWGRGARLLGSAGGAGGLPGEAQSTR